MRAVSRLLLAASLLVSGVIAQASDEADLVALINAYRGAPRECDGRREPMAGPLAPVPALAAVDPDSGGRLGEALLRSGYRAAAATTVLFSGSGNATEIARLIEARYCRVLLDPQYSQIGVARRGDAWRINLARPLLVEGPGDWRDAGKTILRLVNAARARPRVCGEERFAAAAPLAWNEALADAALAHSRDMAAKDYFGHVDAMGSAVAQRVTRAGYRWRHVGENIAAGTGSPEQVVAGWLASPGHCANMMAPDFDDMGAAFATNPASKLDIYWTQTFGQR